ncbi:hypothetical protein N7523_000069 [Penicillium sp. IBT 18751x]|nr:hypothetical protein N7523_000069 [Penicillium sp. IBT 18751x]
MATDDYGKIIDRVGKLKGAQNYFNWLIELKRALKSRGTRHWGILIGEDRPQYTSYRTVPSECTIREHIAKEYNGRVLREHQLRPRSRSGYDPHSNNEPPATVCPESASVEELEEFICIHFEEPNKEQQEWEGLMFTVLDIFISCLDSDLMQHVKQTEDAFEAFKIIEKLCGRPTLQNIAAKWSKLESTVYEAGQQSAEFITNWRRAYVEVDGDLGEQSLPMAIQFSMFVRAVGNHPDTTVWLQGIHEYDLKDKRLMKNVFADFGIAEDQRYSHFKQHPTLSTNNTKKGGQQRLPSEQSPQQSGGRQRQQNDHSNRQRGQQAPQSQKTNNQGASGRSKWFCTYQDRKSAHSSEQCFLNPANAGKSPTR